MKRSLWLVLLLGVFVGCEDASMDAPADNENTADAPADAPADEPKADEPPEGSIGSVVAVVGETTMARDGAAVEVAAGTWVMPGDSVKTGADGKAEVKLGGGSVLRIGPDSEVEIKDFQKSEAKRSGTIKVVAGKFWMNVLKWVGEGESYVEVQTPNAVAGIRGTTLWGDTERDVICSLEGEVEVKSTQEAAPTKGKKRKGKRKGRKGKGKAAAANGPAKLAAGSCASEMSKGLTTPLTPKAEQVAEYLAEVMIEADGDGAEDGDGGEDEGDEGGSDDAANEEEEEGGE